jgi:hypothetical protein
MQQGVSVHHPEEAGMAANGYHFVTRWRVKGTVSEISSIIGDAAGLERWWPSVYLDIAVLEPGDERGIGGVVSLLTKGFLPYTLRWQFRVVESRAPHGFTLEAFGDFVGRGVWAFVQDGEVVDITYDWRIEAQKPILKHLSFVLKPLFSLNHEWAMARGFESLQLELLRRHVANPAAIAAPPAPTWPHRRWHEKKRQLQPVRF